MLIFFLCMHLLKEMDNIIAFQSTGRLAPTKEDKDNFKKVLQSIHGRLSIKMEYFRRYLQTHGEPDGFPRLENDLVFYLEVQKFKAGVNLCTLQQHVRGISNSS